MHVNRYEPQFPRNPTIQDIFKIRMFEEPLVPIVTTRGESEDGGDMGFGDGRCPGRSTEGGGRSNLRRKESKENSARKTVAGAVGSLFPDRSLGMAQVPGKTISPFEYRSPELSAKLRPDDFRPK